MDAPRKSEECLFDAFVDLCGRLDEFDPELFCELATLILRNSPLVRPVRFVAYKNLVHALRSMLLDIRVPGTNIYADRQRGMRNSK